MCASKAVNVSARAPASSVSQRLTLLHLNSAKDAQLSQRTLLSLSCHSEEEKSSQCKGLCQGCKQKPKRCKRESGECNCKADSERKKPPKTWEWVRKEHIEPLNKRARHQNVSCDLAGTDPASYFTSQMSAQRRSISDTPVWPSLINTTSGDHVFFSKGKKLCSNLISGGERNIHVLQSSKSSKKQQPKFAICCQTEHFFFFLRVKFLKDSLGRSSWDSAPRHEVCLKTTQLVALISSQYGPLDKKKKKSVAESWSGFLHVWICDSTQQEGKKMQERSTGSF